MVPSVTSGNGRLSFIPTCSLSRMQNYSLQIFVQVPRSDLSHASSFFVLTWPCDFNIFSKAFFILTKLHSAYSQAYKLILQEKYSLRFSVVLTHSSYIVDPVQGPFLAFPSHNQFVSPYSWYPLSAPTSNFVKKWHLTPDSTQCVMQFVFHLYFISFW